jgi:glycosyltransferase involved in cell wall biosynthesis
MIISIVIPCYNEEAVLEETIDCLINYLTTLYSKKLIAVESYLCFVDDGSTDRTWKIIETAIDQHSSIKGIKLSRNQGHQNALLAGLLTVKSDVVISLDADLQDDINVIEKMIVAFKNGSDIVYGVRKKRTSDTFFKRFSAQSYYRVLALFNVEIIYNHADYRLMSRRTLKALSQFKEVNLFLRGIVPQIGFQSTTIYYDRMERQAGESKYPLSKMLALAWQGITSFSIIPLRLITTLGLFMSIASFSVALWAFYIKFFSQEAIPGWASTVIPIFLLGGIQLFCIGILGEYLGKIYMEIKNRPRYFIEEEKGFEKNNDHN